MSLPKFDTQGSLFESLGSLAGKLFSDQDRYKLFATKIWPLLAKSREELASCYVLDNGRPGVEPVILLGVLMFQFMERVPDRQAAELVKYHLGWKLALNLDLNFKGIHHTTLSYFRERLLANDKADLAMRIIAEGLQAAGLVRKRDKQRLDSSHIIGAVARLSALECVRETLALALEELQPRLKAEQLPQFWALIWERYVESKLDYKSNEETLRAKQRQAGVDCLQLLQWLEPLPAELKEGKQVALLRKVFSEQYVVQESGQLEAVKVHATGVVQNPHDAEAEWSAKGTGKHKKEWVGYKVQVAETVPQAQGQIGFITSVVTQRATQSDDPGLELTLAKQEQMGLERPSEMYVDGAYISANTITEAAKEGWELMGPAQPSPGAPKQPELYRIEAFDVNIQERKATCPQGKTSTECSKLTEAQTGKITYRFEFGRQCQDCEVKHLCVPRGQPHRMIRVGALHEALQQRRREQQSLEFKLRMRQRNGIEGTISELVRAHGMRRARYRGFAKVDLQNQLIAAAGNIKRWLAKLGAVAVAPFKRDSQTHLAPEGLPAAMGLAITRILARISKKLIVLATPKLA
jgi:transposase